MLRSIALSAFACLVAGCGEAPLEPRDPTPGVPHFRFVTYNVHYPEAGDGSTLSAIEAARGDIVCLQETDAAWRTALLDRLSDVYPYIAFQPFEEAAGLGVLSRYPIVDKGLLPRPEGWHPAWLVVIETPAGPIQALHVHLRAAFDGEGNPVSSVLNTGSDHEDEIREFARAFAPDLPRVVLGDFNEEPDGAAIDYLERRGFRNALPLFHPGQPTWKGTSVANQLAMTVDHVLFDRAFAPLNAFVLARGRSDHLPVVAHLEATRHFARDDRESELQN